jgi:hypothetical protein
MVGPWGRPMGSQAAADQRRRLDVIAKVGDLIAAMTA